MAGWSGELVSLPAICRLWAQFPSPPSHATLPTTGASVTVIRYIRMTVTGPNLDTRGYGRKLATTLTRPKTPIIIIDAIFPSCNRHDVLHRKTYCTSIMYDPSEDPAYVERVFHGLYAFLHLQENAQNTAQLNSKRSKTMRPYVHCIYSDYSSIIQSVEIVCQAVSPHRSVSHF